MKKFNLLMITMIFMFLGIINVKAENVDFACKYKNGSDEIVLNVRGERATKVSFGITSKKFKNSSEYTFYPANYIIKSGNQYQTAPYYGFVENNTAVYGCPNRVYLANNNGEVIYVDVVDTANAFGTSQLVNGQGSFKMPLVFFSDDALKIQNNKITSTKITFDSALEDTISIGDYKASIYSLQQSASAAVETESPVESSEKIQYCYYKSSCNKVIELKFTKGNVNMAVFNNGRGLNDWTNTSKCPTSIVDSNNLFQGKSTSCGSGATNCYEFLEQSSTQKSSLIQDGNCSTQSYDTNNGGVVSKQITLNIPEGIDYDDCQALFGNEFLNFLQDHVFIYVWIGVPIILIVLTSFDFAKVVFNDDKDGMPNAIRRFGKRAIAAVLIFLTPTILLTIANLAGVNKNVTSCMDEVSRRMENES